MRSSRPASRIAKAPLQHMRKPDPKRNAGHLKFVRDLPCCICGKRAPSEAHHENYDLPDNGMGMKAHDRTTVPLCAICHERRHRIGAIAFWGDTDIAKRLMDALWRASGDADAGNAVVFKAWQSVRLRGVT